ncbi:effector-associated domain 2-containing protein [Dactylosporangium sp. CA-092794]|uniref:VMAP-C domain-containing protein n=1 Tax=Dactylosporangium sp. CA-092794 TaxID=3239929 RepID=UPI003D9506E0
MSHPPVLPVDVLRHLARELYAISAMKDRDTRNAVVGMVEGELGDPLHAARTANDWLDTVEILRACLAARSGLAVLVQVVELIAPGESATTRFAADCAATGGLVPAMLTRRQRDWLLDVLDGTPAPIGLVECFMAATAPLGMPPRRPDSFRALVAELEERTSSFPLFSFLERVTAAEPDSAAPIREWVDANIATLDERRHAELRSLRARLGGTPAVLGARTHVLIRLQPDELSDSLATAQAWIFPDGGAAEMSAGSETPLRPAQLPGWLERTLADLRAMMPADRRPIIEFMVEPHEMNHPVDSWDGGDGLGSLGARYPVVVRPATRTPAERQRWHRHWAAVGRSLERPLSDVVHWFDGSPHELGEAQLRHTDRPCVVLALDPARTAEPHLRELLEAGVPVMLWIRGPHALAERRTAIDMVLRGRELAGLPDSVRAFRANGWRAGDGDIRRDYVLFWDDPTRMPPERYDLCLPGRRDGDHR